jgi:HTH-type transcriptional regulator/antitoxin HigA
METNQQFNSDLAIPPGEYLLEVTEELDMPQAELARRMGRPNQAISEIIKGHKAITPETALQLEEVVGVPAHIWTGLEADYQLAKAREEFTRQVEAEAEAVTRFPYPEMAKMGLVKATRNRIEKVKELRRFFGIASLFNLAEVRSYAPAFRQTNKGAVSHEALAVWLRAGEQAARRIETQPYDAKRLKELLPALRSLTKEPPERFEPQLKVMLAECGVALVLLPHLPKTFTQGATFWPSKDKAVLMMTLRGSWADIFWFSLFHELGHILLHDKRHVFLEDGAPDPEWQQQEEEADRFAQQTLIPDAAYERFIGETFHFTEATIKAFADTIGICPGIVTGRLQHDKRLPHTSHMHRSQLKWAEVE